MGLAALPLADVEALRFSAPLMITLLSVVMLGEKVGPRRWLTLDSVAALFEYLSLPINVMWGLIFWQEIPTWMTLAGALLTLSSGMYILYRERRERSVKRV